MTETAPQREPTEWLVMFYMAADNNLTEDMILAMQDLAAEGPPSGYRIVAQFDPSARERAIKNLTPVSGIWWWPNAPVQHESTA